MADQQNIVIEFKNLPEVIKNWLSSDLVTNIIWEINRKFGFLDDLEKGRVVPTLVLQICTREVEPQDLIKNLTSGLNITDSTAKSLAEEIEMRVLKPIASPLLKEINVDIKKSAQIPPTPPPVPPVPTPQKRDTPTEISLAQGREARPFETRLPPEVKIPINVTSPKPPLPPIKKEGSEGNRVIG